MDERSEAGSAAIGALYDQVTSDPGIGFAGPKIVGTDGAMKDAGRIVWSDASTSNWADGRDPALPEFNYTRDADFVSSAAFMFAAAVWHETGGFDLGYLTEDYASADLALRAGQAGYRSLYCPKSVVMQRCDRAHKVQKAEIASDRALLTHRFASLLRREHFEKLTHPLRSRDRAAAKRVVVFADCDIPEADRDAGSRNILEMMKNLRLMGAVVKFWPDDRATKDRHGSYLEDLGIEVLTGSHYTFESWIKVHGVDVDVVIVARPEVATPYMDTLARTAPTVARAYYGHDLHHRRMSMEAAIKKDRQIALDAERMKIREWMLWREADAVVYPSEEEALAVREIDGAIEAVPIVPFCFDSFSPLPAPPQNANIVFVAGFRHPPNIDAAIWLARDVFPRIVEACPAATLWIAGSNPTPEVQSLQQHAITVTGSLTSDELEALYSKARVAVVPLRFGAGVKLKVVEALHRGLPLVTTPIGAQGLPGVEEVAVVTDSVDAIAEAILLFLRHDDLWAACAERQQMFARQRFARRCAVEAMEKMLDTAQARAASRVAP